MRQLRDSSKPYPLSGVKLASIYATHDGQISGRVCAACVMVLGVVRGTCSMRGVAADLWRGGGPWLFTQAESVRDLKQKPLKFHYFRRLAEAIVITRRAFMARPRNHVMFTGSPLPLRHRVGLFTGLQTSNSRYNLLGFLLHILRTSACHFNTSKEGTSWTSYSCCGYNNNNTLILCIYRGCVPNLLVRTPSRAGLRHGRTEVERTS